MRGDIPNKVGKVTFGCGAFIPGLAPGNVTEFDSGGTIDSGGGGNPPDPPTRIDPPGDIGGGADIIGEGDDDPGPDPGTPITDTINPNATPGGAAPPPTFGKRCVCTITTGGSPNYSDDGDQQNGGSNGEIITVTRVYGQTCRSYPNQLEADAAREANDRTISNQNPPARPGDWEQVGPAVASPRAGQGCKVGGQCGGPCPNITVRSYWRRRSVRPPGGPGGAAPPPVRPPRINANEAGGGLEIVDDNQSGGFVSIGGQDDFGDEGGGILVDGGGSQGRESGNNTGRGLDVFVEANAGKGATVKKFSSQRDITQQAIETGELNLDDPSIVASVLAKKPYGIQDSVIAFATNPPTPEQVPNDSGYTDFFKDTIDSNLLYILKNTKRTGNWDSRRAAAITPELIFENLNDNVKSILAKIRNFDGSRLNQIQIFNMIGSRVLDGTLKKLSIKYLQEVAEDSAKRVPVTITRSSSDQVNEVAALALIDKNKFPLDPGSIGSLRDSELIRNWKVVPSDVDMFIPFKIDGVTRRFYINDDETFVDRVTLSLNDGNYFDIVGPGITNQRLFAESEVDHAFYIPESTRQKAIQILGGEAGRTLTVSAEPTVAASIEYDSSLSSPRQSYYLLSGVLSSLETQPSLAPSYLLKDSRMEYKLIDTTTDAGRAEADEYIRYKANKRIFVIDHEDLILDYIEETSSVHLSQTDILFDSPKENKSIPLLTRQIPWYIMVVPTNRTDYNLFNSKSRILEITSAGAITRELRCKTSIVPEFSKRQTNKFIKYSTVSRDGVDVLGNSNTQARQTVIEVNDSDFKKTYNVGGSLVGTDEYKPNRDKTPIRIVRDIINELDTNYELSINGIGKSLTEFDVFSRLTLKQFNKLSRLESFDIIKRAVQNGLVNDVKLIPPISKADTRISFNKTQLVQRKKAAGADTFKQIKATNTGQNIVSPDTDGVGGFAPAG